MLLTDPIADLLTRIRNATMVKHEYVDIPYSKMKQKIAGILKDEGYVNEVRILRYKRPGIIRIYLRYDDSGNSVIHGLKRISKPGRRVYAGVDELPRVMGGLGIAILSTNKGVITDRTARKLKVGGEVLCFVW